MIRFVFDHVQAGALLGLLVLRWSDGLVWDTAARAWVPLPTLGYGLQADIPTLTPLAPLAPGGPLGSLYQATLDAHDWPDGHYLGIVIERLSGVRVGLVGPGTLTSGDDAPPTFDLARLRIVTAELVEPKTDA